MVAAGQVGRRSKREMPFSSLWKGANSVLCLDVWHDFFPVKVWPGSAGYLQLYFDPRIGCRKRPPLRVFGFARVWIAGSYLRSLREIVTVARYTAFSCLRVHRLHEDFRKVQGDSFEVDCRARKIVSVILAKVEVSGKL